MSTFLAVIDVNSQLEKPSQIIKCTYTIVIKISASNNCFLQFVPQDTSQEIRMILADRVLLVASQLPDTFSSVIERVKVWFEDQILQRNCDSPILS